MNVSANLDNVLERYRPLFIAALKKMGPVIASPLFLKNLKDEIEASRNLEGELSKWKTSSAEEIYSHILNDGEMHLILHTYYTAKNVIGYGYASSVDIYVNTKYLINDSLDDLEDLCDIGSNLLHEDGHDKGFSHDFKSTKRRPNSICYILNRVYEKTFRQVYGLPIKKPVVYVVPWYKKILPWNWF